ncbi:unnamed protein product [Phytophthora fragariaefolia]|uniref:Unnamed protein product n=1 Tax=Phytophthora fragariaefolia TaxID=1490495 RepID=A0A9W7CXS5_9STRA|nr:unnamed protein product [Phytophthora fragariaefolia]
MNWVSSSLELAGSLLESVDQQAALTLAGTEEDEEEDAGLPSTTRASPSPEANSSSELEADELDNSTTAEAPVDTDGASSSSSQSKMAVSSYTKGTPPLSGSGNKLAGFVSAISTQLENVSSGRGGDPPLSSNGSQAASLEEECSRLHKELARMKNELRLKEKQLSSSQRSVQICEEELVALEKECKEKIAQVQHEMSVMQQDKNSDEHNFIQALEMKDNQMRALKADLDALTEAKSQYTAEIASLKAELTKAVESKDTLWTSAASASNESEQLIESLRSELQETLTTMNNLKREYAESKNTMFSRQSQLESTNTELVNNVANLERDLARMKEAASAASQSMSVAAHSSSGPAHFGPNSNFASMNDDYRRVQQTLVLTKKSLHEESRKNEVQKQEIIALTEEVRRLKQALEAANESSSKLVGNTTLENERLKEQVKQLNSHASAAAAANGELRIQRLTNRLIEKQETIDSLRSRVTTMDVRFQDIQLRAQRAEEKLARMEQNGGIDDMEMATPRSHRVVTALDVLDRWLLFLGRVFLQAPFARLGMLCYVVLIHFWVFVILSFHTSHLTEEMQLSTAAENAVVEPGADMIPGGVGH